MSKSYVCAGCSARVRILAQGVGWVETLVLTPFFFFIYWGLADLLVRHGIQSQDSAQLSGMLAAGVLLWPAYAALRSLLVGLSIENTPETTSPPRQAP